MRMAPSVPQAWQTRIGNQRDWIWRGWQTRYTYLKASSDRGGPPLLLLHGFGASIAHWRHNVSVLGEHHSIYALDLLGFGASEKAHAPYNPAFWADQVHDFWQTFIRQPVVLVGNSIGSLACLVTAAKYPDMVKGLVLINLPDASVLENPAWVNRALQCTSWITSPLLDLTKGILTAPLVFDLFFRVLRSSVMIRLWARQAYASVDAINEELIEILKRPAHDRDAPRALRALIHSKSSGNGDYTARRVLPELQPPALLLWGKQDRMVPPKLAPLFLQYNPNLTLVEIPDAGHCPHDEQPAEVNQVILEWLVSWRGEGRKGRGGKLVI